MEYLDVLIVGAGLSGIGAAYYLQRDRPDASFALLEARGATGGTWDLFRYPGVRSDSDLHTFGYAFRPWTADESIAGGSAILDYLRDTADAYGITDQIRLHHKVVGAAWSTADARWTVDVEQTDTGERLQVQCGWLFCASGYYRYDEGYTPQLPGLDRFEGTVVHPQHWPGDLDYAGRRVVVVGSGATAVTLIPALAPTAAHVTMLQRTPTYILPIPSVDPLTRLARRLLPPDRAHELMRRKNIVQQNLVYAFCQRFPAAARRAIRWLNKRRLPDGYPVDEHFNPPYDPWDQRLCLVPDDDLFEAISDGSASVVTDHIETFTEHGVQLQSGQVLAADIVVTATGLNLLPFGGIELSVDGEAVDFSTRVAYKGLMLSGVPNFCIAIGYTNASWTLKIELLCEHFGRLLAYMEAHDYAVCRPELSDPDMPTQPLLDFGAGYVRRSIDELPRQGDRFPWLMPVQYQADQQVMKSGRVDDEHLRFLTREQAAQADASSFSQPDRLPQ